MRVVIEDYLVYSAVPSCIQKKEGKCKYVYSQQNLITSAAGYINTVSHVFALLNSIQVSGFYLFMFATARRNTFTQGKQQRAILLFQDHSQSLRFKIQSTIFVCVIARCSLSSQASHVFILFYDVLFCLPLLPETQGCVCGLSVLRNKQHFTSGIGSWQLIGHICATNHFKHLAVKYSKSFGPSVTGEGE